MKQLIYLLFALITLASCSKQQFWIKATVPEGKNHSSLNSLFTSENKMATEVMFDESNITDTTMNFISKVVGRSDGLRHMEHSARIGYRYNAETGVIDLFGFSHVDGDFIFNRLGSLNLNEPGVVGYHIDDEYYRYYYKDARVFHERSDERKFVNNVGYTLKFYFGGNPPAPHDMNLYFRVVEWPFN